MGQGHSSLWAVPRQEMTFPEPSAFLTATQTLPHALRQCRDICSPFHSRKKHPYSEVDPNLNVCRENWPAGVSGVAGEQRVDCDEEAESFSVLTLLASPLVEPPQNVMQWVHCSTVLHHYQELQQSVGVQVEMPWVTEGISWRSRWRTLCC